MNLKKGEFVMVRRIVLTTLCCAAVASISAMDKDDVGKCLVANAFTTSYVSPRVTKMFQETDQEVEEPLKKFLNFRPRQFVFLHKENQTIACSHDRSKVAVAGSYHFSDYHLSHFLNYGEAFYYLNVFDAVTNRLLYALNCLEKPICHLKFVDNNRVRAYYKGSEYVGSDTVQEWDLSAKFNTVQEQLIKKLREHKGKKLVNVDRYNYAQLPKAVQEFLIEDGVRVPGHTAKKWKCTLGLID